LIVGAIDAFFYLVHPLRGQVARTGLLRTFLLTPSPSSVAKLVDKALNHQRKDRIFLPIRSSLIGANDVSLGCPNPRRYIIKEFLLKPNHLSRDSRP